MKHTLSMTFAAALVTAQAAAADVRLAANCHASPTSIHCAEILAGWADDVERVTEGRVTVNILAKSIAPPAEQLVSIRNGVFDVATQFNAFIAEEAVGPAISLLPFAGSVDARANAVALWRTYEQFLSGQDEFDGAHLLGFYASPGADFYSLTDTPILSLEDIRTRRMWGLPGVTSGVLKDAGSAAVSGPAAQMTEIIQRGVVDGFVGIAASDAFDHGVADYARSVTRTTRKIFAPTFSILIGDAAWDQIDPADQEMIMSVSGEALAERAGAIWNEDEAEALAKIEGMMDIHRASPEFEAELETLAAPYIGAWIKAATAKGFDAAAALEFYTRTMQELAAE